eukprot:m.52412 g.52412  ORF g.52412 m.52412 type:complete len:467 (+) comp13501_c0_seq1:65-1465(+)
MPYYKYDPVDNKTLAKDSKQSHSSMPLMGPVDITESPEKLKFVVDVPGLSSKDVHVRVTSDLLQISGQRTEYTVEEGEQVHRMERSTGRFCRTFRLPPSADHQKVQAHCEHGVLTVIVDKDAELAKKALALADRAAESEGDGSLNDEFKAVPMSIFPTPALGKIVVLKSDMSILDAVNMLSDNHILSAPVRDVDMPDDAAWTDKYIGILDMIGVVFHMLDILELQVDTSDDFKAEIEKVKAFRETTVKDAITFARFGPFVPVDFENGNLLDCMLLGGHHGIRRVPVVQVPGGDLVNIITQSALVQTLSANLPRFSGVASKTMRELGFGDAGYLITINVNHPLKEAFQLIRDNNISAVPVVEDDGTICGNISARDVRLIVSSSKIYKLFGMSIRAYLDVVNAGRENKAVVCSPDDTLEDVITSLVQSRIHRIYVVDAQNRPLRVVSLRNVLKKFVKEPEGYFGRYFS